MASAIATNAATLSLAALLTLGLGGLASPPASAALAVGATAPQVRTQAALDGEPFTFSLADALAKGPVVLYFFPAAFTTGCSIEAHAFAEAVPRFAALNATVIGVSTDDLPTLQRFSKQACQGKFPVASDADRRISQSFDALLRQRPDRASRISYVIAPDGRIAASYEDLNPDQHVAHMLKAVQALSKPTTP